MDFNPKISLFDGISPKPVGEIDVDTVLTNIENGTYKNAIEKLRNEIDEKKKAALKKKLPAVTWSALFKYRDTKKDNLISYSSLICHDVDKLTPEQLTFAKEDLQMNNFVYAIFISPSGNGLKIIFRVDLENQTFLDAWHATARWLKSHDLEVDQSCKDYSRLCFLSFDDYIFYNPTANIESFYIETWNQPDWLGLSNKDKPAAQPLPPVADQKKTEATPAKTTVPTAGDHEAEFLKECHKLADKEQKGNYNSYINLFAMFACRYDIDEQTCARAIANNCNWPEPNKEDFATIRSAYKKFGSERGIWKDNYKQPGYYSGIPMGKPSHFTATAPTQLKLAVDSVTYYDEVKFWFEKSRSRKEKFVVDEDTGEMVKETENKGHKQYEIDEDDFIIFLQNNGFYKLRIGKKGYRWVRLDLITKIVDTTSSLEVKEFVLDYLKSVDTLEYKKVRRLFRKQAKNLTGIDMLEGMEYKQIDLNADGAHSSYIYFENCFFEIGLEDIKAYNYTELNRWIWKDQIIPREYKALAWQDAHFALFLQRAVVGRKCAITELDETEDKKWMATVTGIGYMLHQFKDPTVSKAVLAVDKKIQSGGEHNGGTGKSLLGEALGRFVPSTFIDGKTFDFKNPHRFQSVKPDTRIIRFDDVRGNFQFDNLFAVITGEFSYKSMYQPEVTVAFKESPKFYISLNAILKGDSNSFTRRQHVIEFSDYYNQNRQPIDEFVIRFFDDWDESEWSRFYSFMLMCIKEYLNSGLVPFPAENYQKRQLLEWFGSAGEELNDYLNETVLERSVLNREFDQDFLFKKFREQTTADSSKISTQALSTHVKMWAKINGLEINAHKNGGRDRRNNITYLRFTPIIQPEPGPDVFEQAIAAHQAEGDAQIDLGLM